MNTVPISAWELYPIVEWYFYASTPRFFAAERGSFPAWVMIIPEEGSFDYAVGDQSGSVSVGSVLVCPPNVEVCRAMKTPISHHAVQFSWRIPGGDEARDIIHAPIGMVTIDNKKRLSSDLDMLRPLFRRNDPLALSTLNHLIDDILHLCYFQAFPDLVAYPSLTDDVAMDSIARHLREKFADPISLRDLAEEAGVTPVQFTRRFNAAFHATPSEYLSRLRLQNAKTLLMQTNLSIQEVAEQSGYESGLYLSRLFRRRFNTTPGMFRREHRL